MQRDIITVPLMPRDTIEGESVHANDNAVDPTRIPLSRRTLLRISAAGLAGLVLSTSGRPSRAAAAAMAGIGDDLTLPIPDMVPFDLSTLDRSLFTTHEQGIVQYLVSLADIANNMEDADSETLGWFHRGYQVYPPEPWDARNQESVYTLAWFYTYDAAWNPYYLDPVLRDHVYAAMRYYLKIQGAEGWWPSDSWTDKNRAATGFALVYLGEAAVMMEGVGWDAAVRAEVLASLQRGAEYMLDPSVADVWDVGMRFSNQIIGSMTGIASYKHLMPAHIETAYQERLDFLVANCQSPGTGYLYEDGAFDAHYSLYTSLRDLAIAFERTADDRYRQMALTHLDWCRYNFLWEPDGAGWTVNGISTRQSLRSLAALRTTDGSNYPDHLNIFKESHVVRALNWNAEHAAALQAAWAAGTVPVTKLTAAGTAPQNLRLTDVEPVFPTLVEREAAIAEFPYMGTGSFVEARSDAKYNTHYVFVKRAGYYFGSHHGTARSTRIRRGPSFFYRAETGAFIATQMATDSAWATIVPGGVMDAKATILQSSGGYHDTNPFSYAYTGASGRVVKTFQCGPTDVQVSVSTPQDPSFVERVPLVITAGDEVSLLVGDTEVPVDGAAQATARGVRIRRAGGTFELTTVGDVAIDITLTPTTVVLFSGAEQRRITNLDMSVEASALSYKVHVLV
jgi:hypothetical protein